ncbi:MAG: hypothetical protein IPJ13_24005 [Saprospiraceae bacterium]|nr:hypothetical protein [Saprospiraceae bacterium]
MGIKSKYSLRLVLMIFVLYSCTILDGLGQNVTPQKYRQLEAKYREMKQEYDDCMAESKELKDKNDSLLLSTKVISMKTESLHAFGQDKT